MDPADAFDAVHVAAAGQVDAFAQALQGHPEIPPKDARLHADNAYVFVEYLANTFPKMPREADERDLWVFLFDYYILQGPFAGRATRLLPLSLRLFFEFLARRERVREIEYIREACTREEFYLARLEGYEGLARDAEEGAASPEQLEDRLIDWWEELDRELRTRGLAPDISLAGGEQTWAERMGPMEAGVFDALCRGLAARARVLRARGAAPDAIEKDLLEGQRHFMTSVHPALKTTPLEAIRREREALPEGL